MSHGNDRPQRAKHGPSGRLFLQDGLTVPVSISEHRDDLLIVVLDGLHELLSGPLSLLMLESTGSRGIVRTRGAAELVEGNLLKFTLDDSVELVQRREFVRVIAAKRVVLEDDEGEVIADALTVDISGGGIRVQLPRSVEMPEEGRVFFSLFLGLTDYDDQVNGTAQIVDVRPDNQVALAFEHIAESEQDRLIRFVFERQRAALRLTRGDTL